MFGLTVSCELFSCPPGCVSLSKSLFICPSDHQIFVLKNWLTSPPQQKEILDYTFPVLDKCLLSPIQDDHKHPNSSFGYICLAATCDNQLYEPGLENMSQCKFSYT